MKNVESTLPRPFTAEDLRIYKFLLMGKTVTYRTWLSSLQAETSTVVTLRMTLAYPQHETGTYNTRTGFHAWPTETHGPPARDTIQANAPFNSKSKKPEKQRAIAEEEIKKINRKVKTDSVKEEQALTELEKEKRKRNRKRKNAKGPASNEIATVPSESASSLDNTWAPALQHLFGYSDLPAVIEPKRGQKADAFTPGDLSLHSKEELDDQGLFPGLQMKPASDGSAVKESTLLSDQDLFNPDLTSKSETKPVPGEPEVEGWLSYPDRRLDDIQAQLFAMQQPVGPPVWSKPLHLNHKEPSTEVRQIGDTRPPTKSKITAGYMFPVFTWPCEIRTKEDFRTSQAKGIRTLESTLDALDMDISKSRYAQEGWGELHQVEEEVYNNLRGKTQLETEALNLESGNSALSQKKQMFLDSAKQLSNFFIPNNYTCKVTSKYWGAVFKIMAVTHPSEFLDRLQADEELQLDDIHHSHILLKDCSGMLKYLLETAEGIQNEVKKQENSQGLPHGIPWALCKAYRSIVMLFINVASRKAQEQTHKLGFQRAAKECLQLMQEGKYQLMDMIHSDDFTGSITSEAVNVEVVITLVMERIMEGFSAVDTSLLDLYASHIERLVRQTCGCTSDDLQIPFY